MKNIKDYFNNKNRKDVIMKVKYANENTLEVLNKFKTGWVVDNFEELTELIYENFNQDDCSDKIKSLKNMLNIYETEPEYREGIEIAFITLTGYSIGSLLEKVLGTK